MRPLFPVRLFSLLILLQTFSASAGSLTRTSTETDSQLVERLSGQKMISDDTGKLQVAATDKLPSGKGSVVGFTKFYADAADHSTFDLQINLVSTVGGEVELAKEDACEVEGGSPILRSFFYVNVDQDPDLEIGLICGWKEHSAADCPQSDQARFFKVAKKSDGKFELRRVENSVTNSLTHKEKSRGSPGAECEGIPNFKNAADVKRLLAKAKH